MSYKKVCVLVFCGRFRIFEEGLWEINGDVRVGVKDKFWYYGMISKDVNLDWF